MWSITYETVTPESAEEGEAESSGFLHESLTFREAMEELRWHLGCHVGADRFPICASRPPRWFTFYDAETDYGTGEVTHLALHIPANITGASRMRVARLIGCYGAK